MLSPHYGAAVPNPYPLSDEPALPFDQPTPPSSEPTLSFYEPALSFDQLTLSSDEPALPIPSRYHEISEGHTDGAAYPLRGISCCAVGGTA
jgi:hypothetical protein